MSLINNFRKDLVGQVYQFSEYNSLLPGVDDLKDPKVFNERFERMHRALISTASALGEVASRDKKYLQEFFRGTVNPIYVKSHIYEDPTLYLYDPAFGGQTNFDNNGNPVTFTQSMIRYNYNDVVMDSSNDYYEYVFMNGKLLPRSYYTLFNSAYGLKLYIKYHDPSQPSRILVEPSSKITLVLNRVFAKNYSQWSKVVSTGITDDNFDEVINTSFLEPFYDPKYVRVAYKAPGMGYYKWTAADDFSIVPDAVSGSVRIRSNVGVGIPSFSVVKVINTLAFWDFEGYIKPDVKGIFPDIDLFIDSTTSKDFPVPFKDSKDFFVFLNGFKLRPDIDYFVHDGTADGTGIAKLKLLTRIQTLDQFHLRIVKNELFYNEDGHYMVAPTLATDGLVEVSNPDVPVMPKLGFTFTASRFEDAQLTELLPTVFQVTGVSRIKSYEYIMNIPKATEIQYVMDNFKNQKTEFEKLVILMGGINGLVPSGDWDANTPPIIKIRDNLSGGLVLTDNPRTGGSVNDHPFSVNSNSSLTEWMKDTYGTTAVVLPNRDTDKDGLPDIYNPEFDPDDPKWVDPDYDPGDGGGGTDPGGGGTDPGGGGTDPGGGNGGTDPTLPGGPLDPSNLDDLYIKDKIEKGETSFVTTPWVTGDGSTLIIDTANKVEFPVSNTGYYVLDATRFGAATTSLVNGNFV